MAGLGQQAQERYRERIKQSVVQRFVDKNVLLEAARENDLAVDESEVEEVMDNIKSGLPEGLTFEDALAQGGMTPTQLQARIEEDLMVEKLVENRLDDVSEVTEADAREFYDENKAQFEAPETVEARHILVKVDPEAGEDAKAEKKAQAELYREELLEGADFAELAKEKSEGPSAQKGGELGVLRRGQTVPEFEEAAFSQEIGKVGPVVETKFGYHIIEVLEKTEAGTTPFEDVKEDIISYLTRQSEQEAIGSYIDKLKGEVEIDYPGGKPQMPQPAAGPMQPQPVPSPSQ
jgi:peptidyl-prolyl cis-trans isomerase C